MLKALREEGYVESFHRAGNMDELLAGLAIAPMLLGIPWYSRMSRPEGDRIRVGGVYQEDGESWLVVERKKAA